MKKLEKVYRNVGTQYLPKQTDYEGRVEFLTTMINKEILAIKADELGYDKDPKVVEAMDAYKRVGLQAGYVKLKIGDKIDVTEEDLREYYKHYGRVYRIKQVLVDTKVTADEVYDLLKEGADFETVCKQYSKAEDAQKGGSTNEITYGNYAPLFQDVVFNTPPGEVTTPIRSPYGYFVIKIMSEVKKKRRTFEESRSDLEKLAKAKRQKFLSNEMSQEIRDNYGVKWYEEYLALAFEILPPDGDIMRPPSRDDEVYPLLKIDPIDLDKPLVEYKGKAITLRDFSDLYDRESFFRRPKRQFRAAGVRQFLTHMIMNELVVDEMKNSRIEEEPQIAEALRVRKEQFMVERLYEDLVRSQGDVPLSAVERYYNDNRELFRTPEQRRFLQITVGDRATAQNVFERIQNGLNFRTAVGRFSLDENVKQTDGDLGFVSKTSEAEHVEIGFAMKRVGEVSEPFQSSNGWSIIQMTEIKPEGFLSWEQAQQRIYQLLKGENDEERLNELLAKWKQELGVIIYEKNLKKATLERETSGVRWG